MELQLSDMLLALRAELQQAQAKAEKEKLKFALDDIEVEISFTTSTKDSAKGGVKFWVINAEAGVETAAQTVHRVKLKIRPELEGGGDMKISGKAKKPE